MNYPTLCLNMIVKNESEIITILEPTSEFSEYFENAVDAIHRAKNEEEEISDESEVAMSQDLMTMMLDTVGPDTSIIH